MILKAKDDMYEYYFEYDPLGETVLVGKFFWPNRMFLEWFYYTHRGFITRTADWLKVDKHTIAKYLQGKGTPRYPEMQEMLTDAIEYSGVDLDATESAWRSRFNHRYASEEYSLRLS